MPRYFFNIEDHVRDEDPDGQELAGPDQARIAGVVFAGDYLSENPELIWDGERFAVEVKDEVGAILLRVVVTATDHSGS